MRQPAELMQSTKDMFLRNKERIGAGLSIVLAAGAVACGSTVKKPVAEAGSPVPTATASNPSSYEAPSGPAQNTTQANSGSLESTAVSDHQKQVELEMTNPIFYGASESSKQETAADAVEERASMQVRALGKNWTADEIRAAMMDGTISVEIFNPDGTRTQVNPRKIIPARTQVDYASSSVHSTIPPLN